MSCSRQMPMLLVFSALVSLSAAPNIEFDHKEVDCGNVYEGTTKMLEAVFTIKNSGDEPLLLTRVRPGCGCTVVDFDSLIAPGKSSRLVAAVTISGFRSGPMAKPVSVWSNAPNDSIARLLIRAQLQAPIDPSTILIAMRPQTKTALWLTTTKNDLNVSKVTFTPSGDAPDSVAVKWDPVVVRYSMIPGDSVRSDGLTSHLLELEPFSMGVPAEGVFSIVTNHPDRKEMLIRGRVE